MVLVKSVEIDIGVKGDREAKASLDDINKRAEALKKAFPEYKLKIDSAAASERLKVFRAQLADATKDRTAKVKVKVDDSELTKFAKKMQGGGPGLLIGSAVALAPAAGVLGGVGLGIGAGLAGAFVAGAGALAAFGAVAKPVLADALKASQAVNTAQNNYTIAIANGTKKAVAYKAEQIAIGKAYAELSPAQIALSRQLGAMADAWDNLKAAQTPVVAGALQPWLKSVTDLTGKLAPIIAAVSPAIHDLGVMFDGLINSPEFRAFRDFIAGTGSKVVSAAGGTLIDLVDAFITLLPKFNPLILKMAGGIASLGPAVLAWANSKKASDDIKAFMAWFNTNGPVVGGLLRNIGGALKALAPGLTAGGASELQAMSAFFGFVAKLPPGIAKPLAEVAGAMLILNKLGVVSVGVKLLGPGAGAAGAAAGAGASAGLWSKLLPGVRLVGGALIAAVIIDTTLKSTSSGSGGNWLDNPFGQGTVTRTVPAPRTGKPTTITTGSPTALTSWQTLGHDIMHDWDMTWNNTIARTAKGFHDLAGWFDTGRHWIAARTDQIGKDITNWWNITWNNTITRIAKGFHDVAGWFDTGRHWVSDRMAGIRTDTQNWWNITWNNTIGRIQRGVHDVATWFDTMRHSISSKFDSIRHDISSAWDTIWNNTVGRVRRGVGDVVSWIAGLPGKIVRALGQAGQVLVHWGTGVINGLLAGMTNVIGSVWTFIKGIPGKILSFLGIHSPPQWAIDAGKHIMNGIGIGMAQAQGKLKIDTKQFSASALANSVKVPNVGAGVARWAGDVSRVLTMLGLPQGLAGRVLYQMQTESGGNPNAINLSDSNAAMGDPSRGLLQTIMSTFEAFRSFLLPNNIYDPMANIYAAVNYAQNRYGPSLMSGGMGMGSGHGYAMGTPFASAGWAWVGERGPELVKFRGGEQVGAVRGGSGGRGGDIYITVNVPPTVNPRDAGRQIANLLGAHIKGGGRIYPAGMTPR